MTQIKKVVLVTGGSRGLGKNMVLQLADKGLDIVLTYHSRQAEAAEVVAAVQARGSKAVALQLDAADVSMFPAFMEKLTTVLKTEFKKERIDYLVNNAGVGEHASITETTEAQFDLLMNVHLKGVFFLTQSVLTLMNDGGGIVNISSGLARFALPGYGAYGAMKAAVEALTRYEARELGARGIRSNVVAPGAIETDFAGGFVRDNANLNKQIASSIALGRVGLPEDIGGVVAFLCTKEARWVNAQRIEVSGGQLI